jgi:lipopolysaccharide transport system permease protein
MTARPGPFRLLWRNRRLLLSTTRNDLKGRFAGSLFGLLWLVLYPLLLLSAYAGVFVFVFAVQPAGFASRVDYVLLIFCGLVPFLGFAEALGAGTPAVASSAGLIKNTLFPIELVPVKAVLVSQAVQVVGTAILVVAALGRGLLTPWALAVPLVWLMQVLFTIGLVWILSSLAVWLRDLQQIVAVLTLLLMMLSPIAWSWDAIGSPAVAAIAALNPLYYVIACHQDCLVHGRAPDPFVALVLVALGLGFFTGGSWFFGRMKRVLVDNV